MEKVKMLPNGISDFTQVRKEEKYYVDKSMFLQKMEEASNFLFLVRPRRFGKSLFLSMVEKYYDCKAVEEWDELFGGLWIHENPTEWKHKYQILKFDFSEIGGDIDSLQERFDSYLRKQLRQFVLKYHESYPESFLQEIENDKYADMTLVSLTTYARNNNLHLYLIIDEYDNFTNTVLSLHGNDMFRALTHGEGFYRDLFKKFKPSFDRILMMGVSPITLDDLTSGFNIATNITSDFRFNQMLGFSEEDVRQMLTYYQETGMLTGNIEEMIEEMKPWYDNYCFAKESFKRNEPKVFNGMMVMHYVNERMSSGHSPEAMLAPNTMIDYEKLKHLIRLEKLEGRMSRDSIIQQIAEEGFIYGDIVDHFPAEEITKDSNFVSLLYYYGMLTITGIRGARLKLSIPNNNVRHQYYRYMLEQYGKASSVSMRTLNEVFDGAALDGQWKPLLQYIADAYKSVSAVRNCIEGERNIQGFMMAYLSLSNYYLMAPEMEMAHGYGDLFLMPDKMRYPDMEHSYIIELKHLKEDDTEATANQQWQDAEAQLRQYAQDQKMQLMTRGTQLHLITMQFRKFTLIRMEEIF